MTRALVLGATGHIGAHVVRALLRRGDVVRAGYRNPRFLAVLDDLPVERVAVDLDEPATLTRALDGCEVVIHCAGYYPGPKDRRAAAVERGIAQLRRVCDALRAQRTPRIVYVSSAATIPRTAGAPATESDGEPWPLPGWRPLYSAVKIAMEHEALRAAREELPLVVVNPSICIGEYDAHQFSSRLVSVFAGSRIPFYLDHAFNVVYTGDVAEGCVAAGERGRPGERYILSHQNMTLRDWALLVAREAGVAAPRWRIPMPVAIAGAWVIEAATRVTGREPLASARAIAGGHRLRHWMDNAKAVRELAMPLTPIPEAIRRTLLWQRQRR